MEKQLQPKLRFPEFSGDWEIKKYIEIIRENRLGGNYNNTDDITDFPLIKMGNIGRGNIILDKIQYLPNTEQINNEDILVKGDLLFNTRNTLDLVGKVAIWNDELKFALYNSNLMRMKFKKTIIEDSNRFMNYSFNRDYTIKQLRAIATGTTSVAAIYNKDLNNIRFFIPSLPEQQKIADYLTTIDKKIELLEEKKTELSRYKKAMMQKLFAQEIRFKDENGNDYPEWEENLLGNICKITTGKLDANAMVPNGNYRFYTCAKDYFRIDKYAFDFEALLISGNGANVGYIHYYNGKFNAYQRTYVLYELDQNYKFIMYLLNTYLHKRISKEKKEGNTPYIVLSTLSEMKLNLPYLPEQQKIADFLSAIDESITKVEEQIKETQNFKKAMLQQLFV